MLKHNNLVWSEYILRIYGDLSVGKYLSSNRHSYIHQIKVGHAPANIFHSLFRLFVCLFISRTNNFLLLFFEGAVLNDHFKYTLKRLTHEDSAINIKIKSLDIDLSVKEETRF